MSCGCNGNAEWPVVKSQHVRLFDIFLLGPAMVVAGSRAWQGGSTFAGPLVALGGVGTMIYNAINYGAVAQRQAAAQGTMPLPEVQPAGVRGLGSGYWEAPQWGLSNQAWQNYEAHGGYYPG